MTDRAQLSHGSGASGAEEVFPAESGRHQGQNEGKEKQASRQRINVSCKPRPVKTEEQKHRCDYMRMWLCVASSGQCIGIVVPLVVPFDVFLCL